MKIKGAATVILILAVLALTFCVFVVDETEQVVITRFGKVVWKPITEPGLNFKLPFEQANRFHKNLLEWDGEPGEVNTQDKTYIWVDTFARWKIVDPVEFFKLVVTEQNAQNRLSEIINAQIRDAITSNPLIETVRKSNRALNTLEVGVEETKSSSPLGKVSIGRPEILARVKTQANAKLKAFGIEVVDVKIKRLNYTENVRESVYGRMIAERKQIAEKFRSEGKGEAWKWQGDKEKELKRINSEAYRTSQEIMGRADAKATSIYAEAFNRDPEFYSFMKTLDVYKQTLKKDSSIVLSTDFEFLKYLKESK